MCNTLYFMQTRYKLPTIQQHKGKFLRNMGSEISNSAAVLGEKCYTQPRNAKFWTTLRLLQTLTGNGDAKYSNKVKHKWNQRWRGKDMKWGCASQDIKDMHVSLAKKERMNEESPKEWTRRPPSAIMDDLCH